MRTFNPEMLIVARESLGMTQKELAVEVDVQQGTISKIESGILQPQGDLVERLAACVKLDIEFFFQSDRVYGVNSTVFYHRKRQSLPEKILKRIHAYLNITRMRIARLFRGVENVGKLPFPQLDLEDHNGSPEEIARVMRSIWMLPSGPIRNVTEAIEDAGGVVVRMDFGTRKIDAVSEWIPGHPPIFLVNSNADVTGDRLRWTLAHEIGHMVFHRFPNENMEQQANEFAQEFLMPRKEIKASLYGLTLAKLAQLKRIWKVSMAALIERAYSLKTITLTQRQYMYMNLSKKGMRTREPVETDIPIEKPTLLRSLTEAHLSDLGYSTKDLMKMLFFAEDSEFRATLLGQTMLRAVV